MSWPRAPALRLAVLATAMVALLALVAFASSSGVPWSHSEAEAEGRSLRLVGRLAIDAAVLVVVVALFGVFVSRMRRPQLGLARAEPDDEPDSGLRSRWARLLIRVLPYVLLAAIAVVTFLFAREVDRRLPRPATDAPAAETPASRPVLRAPPSEARWVLAATGGLVLLTLASFALAPAVRRRLAARAGDDGEEAAAVVRLLDESIDDLRDEPDPRRAVVAAYARMERGLGARGHGRLPYETPLEYLGRELRDLRSEPEEVARLTGLFERAKFSAHPVGHGEKEAAITSLARIRQGLRSTG